MGVETVPGMDADMVTARTWTSTRNTDMGMNTGMERDMYIDMEMNMESNNLNGHETKNSKCRKQ
jgi:hypothetical protein